MTPSHLRAEIERLTTTLFNERLAIDANQTIVLNSHGTSIVTWSNSVSLSSLFDITSAYDQYVESLRQRWFTIVLFDGSLLQFSYTFDRNDLVKHRLSFQPCPVIIRPSELGSFSIEEILDLLEGKEFKNRVRLEGPLRFDFDEAAENSDHPPSHLTISRTSCRVPVSAPLSVGHFIKFLFLHFYPDHWISSDALRSWSCTSLPTCLPELENDRIFVSWRR